MMACLMAGRLGFGGRPEILFPPFGLLEPKGLEEGESDHGYPDSSFPDPASWLVDQERSANFKAEGEHYESRYYLTLTWLPTPDSAEAAGRSLVERPDDADKGRDWHGALSSFIAESDRALDLLASFMPEVRALDDAETLTFLHGTISSRRHAVAAPETPIYLDALLSDTPLTGGLEPRLGDDHIRTLTVLGFPSMSRPGILDALNHQDFTYRWVTRFIALDKSDATKALTKLRRQWFNKRKSITALLREIMYNQPSQLLDTDADNKVVDADLALQVLGGDHVAFGYLTTTITVTDTDRAGVEDKVRQVERIVNGLGFTTIREGVNAVEAWLSSLPGQTYANVRQPLVHTLNLAHLMPLSSVWAGPARNEHLAKITGTECPPLLHASTAGSTPFRLSTHVGDLGHMLVVGPTGAGKSVLLALIALQFRRYADSQVYIFDKGFSARAAVLAMGGAHHALGLGGDAGETLAFQPLRRIDDATERSWAAEWIAALLAHEKANVTPEVKDAVWSALGSLASAPAEERTLTGLTLLLQSNALRTALGAYTLDGPYGRLLDAAEQQFAFADVQCFETEALMGQSAHACRRTFAVPSLRRECDLGEPDHGASVRLARPRYRAGDKSGVRQSDRAYSPHPARIAADRQLRQRCGLWTEARAGHLAADRVARWQRAADRQRARDGCGGLRRTPGQGRFPHLGAAEGGRARDVARRRIGDDRHRRERSSPGDPGVDAAECVARGRSTDLAQPQHPADDHDPARRNGPACRPQGSHSRALARIGTTDARIEAGEAAGPHADQARHYYHARPSPDATAICRPVCRGLRPRRGYHRTCASDADGISRK